VYSKTKHLCVFVNKNFVQSALIGKYFFWLHNEKIISRGLSKCHSLKRNFGSPDKTKPTIFVLLSYFGLNLKRFVLRKFFVRSVTNSCIAKMSYIGSSRNDILTIQNIVSTNDISVIKADLFLLHIFYLFLPHPNTYRRTHRKACTSFL